MTSRRAKPRTCCKPTGDSRSRSCVARACACGTRKGASISTCCRASASPRSATRTRAWRARSPTRPTTLLHTSNLFFHPLQGQLAERLAALSGLPRAFFCNSGTEAVEACLKFARRYWFTAGETRGEIIALEESFHGRTIGALSVTSDEHYRAPFEPLLSGVRWLPANDPAALLAAVSKNTAAIIVEPIQGEGGVRPLTPAFAAAINEASARTGARRDRRRSAVGPGANGAARSTSRRLA